MTSVVLIAAVLAFTPPAEDRSRPVMAVVSKATPQGELTTERGRVSLAGIHVTNTAKAARFMETFVVNRLAKLEYEADGKRAHVYVSADCAAIDRFVGKKPDQADGACVRSVYVNSLFLKNKWAKAEPKGVARHRDVLFGEK